MSRPDAETLLLASKAPPRVLVTSALGIAQIFAWGSSYYLLAVLAKPIAADTGWRLAWIVSGLSLGLLTAGVVSPWVGDIIDRRGGRPVLVVSSLVLALGLTGLATAPSLPAYLTAWLVLGTGMGAGLYEATFATLGHMYGRQARTSIGTITLFGGFSSTVCWPLSAWLVAEIGWRGICLTYAAIHLAIVLPLYVFALPHEPKWWATGSAVLDSPANNDRIKNPLAADAPRVFFILAAALAVGSAISTIISVYLLALLQARHLTLTAAVALGAIVGPAQVGARAIEMFVGRHHHPVWTLIAATIFVAMGIGALRLGPPVLSAALVFYGAGVGIGSIARGTLPLALFDHRQYAAIIGRLAMPSLLAQAAAPSLGALLIAEVGADGTLTALFATAVFDVALVVALFGLLRKTRGAPVVKRASKQAR